MNSNDYKYIGPSDLHDGLIVSVKEKEDSLFVQIETSEKDVIVIKISEIKQIESNSPEGMILYALFEKSLSDDNKVYVFQNWDDDDKRYLNVVAKKLEEIKQK